VLCSPPFYDQTTDKNRLLRTVFRQAENNPERFVRLVAIASKYNLVNKTFSVTNENIQAYLATLSASILTQTSLEDAKQLKKPITLLYGTLDPLVKKRHLKNLALTNPKIKLMTVTAGHEVRGVYVNKVVKAVAEIK
jgi:surfactin synthase thioesterase subunit